MSAAANLTDAAGLTQVNLFALWKASTLSAKLLAFANGALPTFPDETPGSRPIADWLTLIAALAAQVLPFTQSASLGINTVATFQQAADYVYRCCKLGAALNAQNPKQVSDAQAAALLAAYNAQFA